MTIEDFANAITAWVQRYETASVVSWYRSSTRDRSVGGGGNSAHTREPGAVDVVYWASNVPTIERLWPDTEDEMRKAATVYGLRLRRFKAGGNFPKHDHLEPLTASSEEPTC